MEKDKDKEGEDEFGYTNGKHQFLLTVNNILRKKFLHLAKISKRYNLLKDVRKITIQRPPNCPLGLALAGHSDRQRMACFLAGIDPNGLFKGQDVKTGDEIIEVNGNVLQNRCHLNASSIFKNIDGEKVVLIVAKSNDGLSVKPINKFPAFVDDV